MSEVIQVTMQLHFASNSIQHFEDIQFFRNKVNKLAMLVVKEVKRFYDIFCLVLKQKFGKILKGKYQNLMFCHLL